MWKQYEADVGHHVCFTGPSINTSAVFENNLGVYQTLSCCDDRIIMAALKLCVPSNDLWPHEFNKRGSAKEHCPKLLTIMSESSALKAALKVSVKVANSPGSASKRQACLMICASSFPVLVLTRAPP